MTTARGGAAPQLIAFLSDGRLVAHVNRDRGAWNLRSESPED